MASMWRRAMLYLGLGPDDEYDDYDDDDLKHMAKVVGYVHRHLAQKPDGDVSETPWRYSLMNWGHDPEKH